MTGRGNPRSLYLPRMFDPSKTSTMLNSGPTPTFTGATEWIKGHRQQIDMLIKLLYTYPNLIQDENLDLFWDFLQGVFRGRDQRDSLEHDSDEAWYSDDCDHPGSPTFTITNPLRSIPQTFLVAGRTVYLCFPCLEQQPVPLLEKLDTITQALLPFCFLRTNVTHLFPKPSAGPHITQCLNDANVFIFYVTDETLRDKACIDLLSQAVMHNVPIMMIREPGYKLPLMFPEYIRKAVLRPLGLGGRRMSDTHLSDVSSNDGEVELVPPCIGSPGGPKITLQVPYSTSPATSSSSSSSVKSNPYELLDFEEDKLSLVDVLQDGFKHALVYVDNFHENFINKLYDRLSDHLGNVFPKTLNVLEAFDKRNVPCIPPVRPSLKPCGSAENVSQNLPHTLDSAHESSVWNTKTLRDRTNSTGSRLFGPPNRAENARQRSWEGAKLPPISPQPPTSATTKYPKPAAPRVHRPISPTKHKPLLRQSRVEQSPEIAKKVLAKDTNQASKAPPDTYDELEERETAYLIFPDPRCKDKTKKPEIVKWPLKKERNQGYVPFTDSPISFDDCSFNIDWSQITSETPSPELQ